jgi:hypothetical protein
MDFQQLFSTLSKSALMSGPADLLKSAGGKKQAPA